MKAIVLCNIATPKSSASEDVREYLSKFLSDRYVISIPQPFRSILVNGIIIPRRLRHSTARYRLLESLYDGEMPLRKYMNALVETMQGLSICSTERSALRTWWLVLEQGGIIRRLWCFPSFHTRPLVPICRHLVSFVGIYGVSWVRGSYCVLLRLIFAILTTSNSSRSG